MEIKTYAPVIIPTLNRYEHFKRCLESLESCSGAEHTEVYVALDYPPSERYVNGWKKIDAYLKSKENNNGFRKLHVIRRSRNYGLMKGNFWHTKMDVIFPNYESYISTEDDNVFSPCFLEFMNKSLNRFKDDASILKICGYNHLDNCDDLGIKGNYIFSKRGSAWGCGGWVHKDKLLNELYDLNVLKGMLQEKKTYQLFKEKAPQCISYIRSMIKTGQLYGDSIWEIYCFLNDCKFILPAVSMVRNLGFDGTGWHSNHLNEEMYKKYSEKSISQEEHFDFIDDDIVYILPYNPDRKYESLVRRIYKKMVEKIDVFLIRHFNYIPKSKYI